MPCLQRHQSAGEAGHARQRSTMHETHAIYDLKGSWVDRHTKPSEAKKMTPSHLTHVPKDLFSGIAISKPVSMVS